MIRQIRHWAAAAALLVIAPAAANAQAADGRWSVTIHGGPMLFAESSALKTGASLGLDVQYHLSPRFSVGPAIGYNYAETDSEFFVAAVPFGADSTRIYQVGQRLGVLTYALNGRFDVSPSARFAPYLGAGVGGYSIYLDSQAHGEPNRIDGLSVQAGAGIGYALTEAAGVSIDVRDYIFMDYDRNDLNPIRPEHRNCGPESPRCFPGANHDLPDEQDMIHNIRVALGFRYVPGLNR